MGILPIVIVILIVPAVIFVALPKGNWLHESVTLPLWSLRVRFLPKGNYIESKHHYGLHFRQYLLYFRPAKPDAGRRQVVVYFHGGGWQFGRPEMFRPDAQALVNAGYHVFMPSHRRIPFFNFRHMRLDIQAAMYSVAVLMEEHGLAGKKVILGGTSSGGHLAALLSLDHAILNEEGMPGEGLSGLFLMGAAINLGGMWASPPLWMLAGSRKGVLFREANPMNHLSESFRLPTFVIHGTKDGLVEYASVKEFVLKLDSMKQAPVEFVTLPGGIHTDAASWAFPGHPANTAFFEWLQKLERGELDK